MTQTASRASPTWRAMLPHDRDFIALPSSTNPVLVFDRSPRVVDYVRHCMLAMPSGSVTAARAVETARQCLRIRALWRLAPRCGPDRECAQSPVAEYLRASGSALVLVNHSKDPDGSAVVLLFGASDAQPSTCVKVALGPASASRLTREQEALQRLAVAPITAVSEQVPALQPRQELAGTLATTALPGMPMYVAYNRPGHLRPEAVSVDFRAAAQWLRRLQDRPSGPRVTLTVAEAAEPAAARLYTDEPEQLRAVMHGLSTLRRRLGDHQVLGHVSHGDFWPGNILVGDGVVTGVVDWERWQPVADPMRDVARFVATYSLSLDRRTPLGRPVRGLPGLRAGAPGGGIGYALWGTGWYPQLAAHVLCEALDRHALPRSLAADVVLAEVAAIAAEAGNADYARRMWTLFCELARLAGRAP